MEAEVARHEQLGCVFCVYYTTPGMLILELVEIDSSIQSVIWCYEREKKSAKAWPTGLLLGKWLHVGPGNLRGSRGRRLVNLPDLTLF